MKAKYTEKADLFAQWLATLDKKEAKDILRYVEVEQRRLRKPDAKKFYPVDFRMS